MESRYDYKAVEPKIRKFWEDEKVFEFKEKDKRPVYSIDTPPPTVSGDLHLGHVFSYSQAEFIARYKRMRGFNVFYPFGLDNNGLPTELLIEKKFKTTAEHLGREKFVELVRKEIKSYNEAYVELFKKLGISADWNLLYQTISPEVQKISQLSFLELNKKDRVYRAEAPVLYCPKCKTTISQMELKDKVLKSKLIYIKFSPDVTIATTRPELLPACVAIFVNPTDAKRKKLIGKKVKVPIFGQDVGVMADQSIDPAYGTGVEMCCTFGDQNDMDLYRQYKLPLRMAINEKGTMIPEFFKGAKIKEARQLVVEELKKKGFIAKEEDIEHSVNLHERCDTEIELLVRMQWYVRYLDLKGKFLELGRKVKWYPDHMLVRYENWVNGLKWDWGISRQRFFGVHFPLWYCKNCGEVKFAEEKDLPVNPFVDKPKGACTKCGSKEFVPETDIMDTWMTSSLTPLINARWGLDNKYMKKIYPMSLRAQAHEIISFWAFTTIVKAHFHTDSIPWGAVMISGHGLDPHGKPMHKSQGNAMFPEPYVEKYGADALRYWASSSVLGEDNSFQEKELITGSRLINKLWNLARFIEMNCKDRSSKAGSDLLDSWITGELSKTVKKATEHFDAYDYFKARNAAETFFWTFANDYVEFVKHRVYAKEKEVGYTLANSLLVLLKLLSPFIPHATEEIYQKVFADGKKSIHVSEWPSPPEYKERDFQKGEEIAKLIVFIRKWKHDNGLALNAPLSEVVLDADVSDVEADIKGAMNIAKITKGKPSAQAEGTAFKIEIER